MSQKEITKASVVVAVIGMIIANIIWAATVNHDWHSAVERSFFQVALGAVIIVNACF